MRAGSWWRCRTRAARGKADVIERFGETPETGGAGGSGIALYKDAIYAEINDRIAKYPLGGEIAPKTKGITILSGLPLTGDHPMHPFIIDASGSIYVDDATPTNSCQVKNRVPQSPGENPCPQLETRGGIWRYDANKTDQAFSPAERYATGIRNAEGLAFDAAGNLFSTQHGRDQLHANWPQFYKPDQEATLPAEELLLIKKGGDYGWPECYYDSFVQKLVLAPEYGGDGKKIGVCAEKTASGRGVSRALGAERDGPLRQNAISGALSQRDVYRVSRLVGPRAVSAGRIQRGIPAALGRARFRTVRDIRGWLRGSEQIAARRGASAERAGRGTRRRALYFGRRDRANLSSDV